MNPGFSEPLMFPLYQDLLLRVVEVYDGDYATLHRIALVNKEMLRASSVLLYRLVVLSPPASQLSMLNLRDTGAISVGSS